MDFHGVSYVNRVAVTHLAESLTLTVWQTEMLNGVFFLCVCNTKKQQRCIYWKKSSLKFKQETSGNPIDVVLNQESTLNLQILF